MERDPLHITIILRYCATHLRRPDEQTDTTSVGGTAVQYTCEE